MSLKIQPFIFNWKRQFQKACAIEDQLREIFPDVTVINSDEENTRPGWINVGDSFYFGDQFRKAIDLFTGDVLFHIQADVQYDNWKRLVADAKFFLRFYGAGIYAPNVDYSYWTADKTDISSNLIEHSNIKLVGSTDETVWFIHKDVLGGIFERNIKLSLNPLGWGWDCVLSAISYSKGMPVIRDYRHTINHPQGAGYDYPTAEKQMEDMIASLDEDIRTIYSHIRGDRQKITEWLAGNPDIPRILGNHSEYVNGSLPSKRLSTFYNLSLYPTFVETGTFLGEGVQWALDHGFKKIFSIEVDDDLCQKAREKFKDSPQVTILHGNSSEVLPKLIPELQGSVIFYLDAHWSGAYKGVPTGNTPLPLKEENMALMKYAYIKDSLIIIDDARMMIDPEEPRVRFGSAIKTWLLEQWCGTHRFHLTYLDDSLIFQKRQ